MAASVPTTEPTTIRAGDTASWTRSLADYSAADGWILTYYIVGPVALNKAATTSGTGFAVTLTASETATLSPGDYAITGQVTLSGEAFTVYSSRLNVLPNLVTASAGTETRSYWRQVRDALRELLRTTAPDPTSAYTIFGERGVTLMTIDERLKLLAFAEAQVNAEDAANGTGGGSKNVLMRFRNAR